MFDLLLENKKIKNATTPSQINLSKLKKLYLFLYDF